MNILLIDDEQQMLDLLELHLLPYGYTCAKALSGEKALSLLEQKSFQLILLDVMMPNMDGWATCQQIRRFHDTPIIMLTARNRNENIVKGLTLGADDYVTKPFDEQVLHARIEAVLRRTGNKKQIEYMGIHWNETEHWVCIYDEEIILTPTEFSLLGLFLNHPNLLFSREELIANLWGYDTNTEDRTVDSHIKNMREKIRKASFPIENHLKTVYGVGYRWVKE